MSLALSEGVGPLVAAFGADGVPEGFRHVAIETVDQLRDALEEARAHARKLYPTGGGTQLGGIPAPREPGDVLDLRSLNGIVAHDHLDVTVTVRAGETLANLDRALAEHGQYVSLHADFPERATVGGVIASGLPERHELRHVTLRDQVLGVTAYLVDGTRSRSGGRLVKNVTGYDLPKLFTGSRGTLGVLTEVSLRCRMRPESSLVVAYGSTQVTKLDELARHAHDTRPTTVDHLDARAARTLGLAVDHDVLFVRWEGFPETCANRRADLEKLGGPGCERVRAWEGEEAATFSKRLDVLRAELMRELESPYVLAAHALPTDVPALREALRTTNARLWCEPCLGTVRAIANTTDGFSAADLVSRVAAPGRHVALEHAPPAWRHERYPRPSDVPGARWMTRLKRAFDPDSLLWPGAWPEAEIEA